MLENTSVGSNAIADNAGWFVSPKAAKSRGIHLKFELI